MPEVICWNMQKETFRAVADMVDGLACAESVALSHGSLPPTWETKFNTDPYAHVWTSGEGIANPELFKLIMRLAGLVDVSYDLPGLRGFISLPREAYVLCCADDEAPEGTDPAVLRGQTVRTFSFNKEAAEVWRQRHPLLYWIAPATPDRAELASLFVARPSLAQMYPEEGTRATIHLIQPTASTPHMVGTFQINEYLLSGPNVYTIHEGVEDGPTPWFEALQAIRDLACHLT